jgi:hypothetical protein
MIGERPPVNKDSSAAADPKPKARRPTRRKPTASSTEQTPAEANGKPRPPDEPSSNGPIRAATPDRPSLAASITALPGRFLSDMPSTPPDEFMPPFLQRKELTCLYGKEGVGKSCFEALAAKHSRQTVLLHSGEEDLGLMMGPRLDALGVERGRVWAPDEMAFSFIDRLDDVIDWVGTLNADLLIINPMESFLRENASENDNQAVRPFLLAVKKVLAVTGAAGLGTRHCGRAEPNTIPGSRAWRTTPRINLLLSYDQSRPQPRVLECLKFPTKPKPPPIEVILRDGRLGVPVFTFGDYLAEVDAAMASLPLTQVERQQVDIARDIIRQELVS